MDLTAKINQNSIESVRLEIAKKLRGPYFATGKTVSNTVTDMDHHPYTRWYRGVYYYPEPIVMEREAGWRPIENGCYDLVLDYKEEPHRTCPNSDLEPPLLNI